MSNILFYDEFKKAIKPQNHQLITEFMKKFCDEQMQYFDDNIAEWHKAYLEKDQINIDNIEAIWGDGICLVSNIC